MMPAVFHQFGRLPNELQRMIWEEAYYDSMPQVLEGCLQPQRDPTRESDESSRSSDSGDDDERNRIIRVSDSCIRVSSLEVQYILTFPWAMPQTPIPSILHTCRSSREICLRLGGFSSLWRKANNAGPIPVWFDFKSDIICFTNKEMNFPPALDDPGVDSRLPIRHLAVDWAFFHSIGWGLAHDESKSHWVAKLSFLYLTFPELTDLYFFVPAVRLGWHPKMSRRGVHFKEPASCSGLPIVLNPITKASEEVFLPECDCVESRRSWIEASTDLETAFSSQKLKDAVEQELGDRRVLTNFPPRLHHSVFIRKGLKLDNLPNEEDGSKVEVDKILLQTGEE